ncbi:hypothetical protein FNV43_RR10932 [Rhamnella rubrinervis]|uniref:C2 NT-type domain-containing protein n=1 Tax=Rhamnella rubrinervis TaxID=2594499 RepID=A0A8K0H5A6_9ROSA|nr:hypothetical protein FNV43_RR10932 [Rhamnella rubrinervis]
MSRITKWKLEKTKVKVVFRLQFHATHIPQTGWDKLYISFIPADSGKATSKTTKANVRNGTCKWADPIYETTRLLQDIKTKQYDERLYKLVVTMGSSRSSVLGEANINLANYADAQKPSVVALPLQGCDSGTILHVTVQLLTSKTGFREFEQQRELRERGLQTSDESAARKISASEDAIIDHMDKVNARVRFKEELPPLEEVGLNEEYADSAAGFDGSSNTSESLYAEKHDTSSSHEIESLKSTISGDLVGLSLSQSSPQEKGDPSDHRFLPQGANDWAHVWASDYSADNDLANAYEENSRLRGSLQAAESSILDLKLEVSSLQSHAEEIGIEAQKFSHLLADEITSGEQLAKEVSVLRKQCLTFKDDLEQLKISKISTSFAIRETLKTDQDHFFQELQLRWVKGLLDMEDKIRALHNKGCFGFHEMDFRSFNTDLEALLGILQDLKQGTGQQISGLNLESVKEIREMTLQKCDQLLPGTRFGADFYLPEGTLHCANIPALVSQEFDSTDANNAMKGKILELIRESDELKAEKEGLSRKMDQMECYYEALVQELEENQRQMMGELQNLRNEHSTCLYTISATKGEMETINQEMNKQIIKFSEEKLDLDSLNKDLERRAATAEAALKRARLNYSIAVDQLQKDLEVLSFQVLSMYETNENLIKKAFTESSVPSFLGYEERVQTQKLDSKEHHAARLLQCQNQHDGAKKKDLDGDIVSEDLKRSLLLQKALYQKVEEEVYEVHLVNVYLDVFSKTLQETLLDASADFMLMKEKVNNLTQQLELSTESKELLMLKLQAATDEVYNLKEYKVTCDAKCNNLAMQNQVLEKKIQNATHENCLLFQKITESEVLIKELASYEIKFATFSEEKLELENLLKKEMLENGNLQNEVSSLQEEMKALRTEFDELASSKENLQNAVDVLHHMLRNLLASCDKKCNGLPFWSEHICQGLESKDIADIILQLEEIQHSACETIVQLIQEKKDLVHERDLAQLSFNAAQSDNLVMKEKFNHDIANIMGKMKVSSDLVQKLQSEVEAVTNRLKISFEAEENYAQQHRELLSDFDHLKVELEQLASENKDLARDIIALENVSEEVGRCKLEIASLSQEKEALMMTLTDKTEESANLSLALNSLKSSLQSLHDDLHIERSIRDMAQVSLNAAQSDKLVMKQKLEHEVRNIMGKMDVSSVLMQKLESEVEAITSRLKISFEAEENYEQQHRELLSDFERLEVELQQLTSENKDLAQEIMALENVTEELETYKLEKEMFLEEKASLLMTLEDKTEEYAKLALELNSLKSNFQSLREEFEAERSFGNTLESSVTDLTSKLNEKQYELLQFDQLRTELVHLKQFVSDLELEKSRLCCILLDYEERLKIARKECSNSCLERQLSSMFEFSVASDVKFAFTKTQYEVWIEELMQQLYSKDSYLAEFQKKYVNVESMLNSCLASEANHVEESAKLMTSLNSIKSELDASIAQNRVLLDANSTLRTELEECKQRAESRDAIFHVDRSEHVFEVEKLEHRLVKSEEEIDNLIFSKEEIDVKNLVLKAKLDEQKPQIALLEEYKNELMTLQNKYNELAHRLSEQILKTEEFKNLSIHLKELKDKADAECIQAREKREPEGPPLAMQESLRIAFIKEQYETKLLELKHQLAVSKKHSEEMLWKLQDAIDEVERKKKSEASHLKRNEELGMRILELETELQSAISEKREMMKVYDLMKAEKECSSISLECCKEEKLELEASLQKCNEEKSKISVELTSMKDLLESSASALNSLKEENDELHKADCMSNEPANNMFCQKNPISGSPSNGKLRTKMLPATGPMNDSLDKFSDQDISQEVKQACLVPVNDTDHSNEHVNMGAEQDALTSRDVNGVSSLVHISREDVLQSETKHLALVNEHFKAQSLKSSMDHLQRELERMKYENLILTQDDNQFDLDCPALQKELMKLRKVNEELGSIFPLFNEFSCSGNALERVLALEIELAESLQAKKKSSIHFQSSFLKQHSDEEAVFQSFRDINELIKDMLELKRRYATVETELRDMHDRYSQLSLQFAEVEGERQKLMMTLKNVRASKKPPQISRSSTVPLGDHLS